MCLFHLVEFFDTIWDADFVDERGKKKFCRIQFETIKKQFVTSIHNKTITLMANSFRIYFISRIFLMIIELLYYFLFFLFCRLGPRELNISVEQWITENLPANTSNSSTSLLSQQQQPSSHQSKIMNVVVPNVACPPAAAKKIRRKPENKVSLKILLSCVETKQKASEKRRRRRDEEALERFIYQSSFFISSSFNSLVMLLSVATLTIWHLFLANEWILSFHSKSINLGTEKKVLRHVFNQFSSLSLHFQPQSQINKCNNEKRRRELENEYIEQLGEFLQINKRDMTACKPDKAAILSEVVKKVSLAPLFKFKLNIRSYKIKCVFVVSTRGSSVI